MAVASCNILCHHKHCTHVYQGALSSLLRYVLEQSHEFTRNITSTAHIEGRQARPKALLHALISSLRIRGENVMADFNLVVLTLTAKLLNLITC